MSVVEQTEREIICRRYMDLFRSNQELVDCLNAVYASKAYRLGKFLLFPFRILKQLFIIKPRMTIEK